MSPEIDMKQDLELDEDFLIFIEKINSSKQDIEKSNSIEFKIKPKWVDKYSEDFWEILTYYGISEEDDDKAHFFNKALIKLCLDNEKERPENRRFHFNTMREYLYFDWIECKRVGLFDFMDFEKAVDVISLIAKNYIETTEEL